MKRLVVLDFDGTITTQDTLPLFLKYAFGKWRYYWGILICSHWIIGYKLKIITNAKAKEHLLKFYFEKMPYSQLQLLGERFAYKYCDKILKKSAMEVITEAIALGDKVYIVSANIKDWVAPFFDNIDVNVIATEMEVGAAGLLSGRYKNTNCYGAEKLKSLRKALPDMSNYRLVVYGDSRGDKELLEIADERHYKDLK